MDKRTLTILAAGIIIALLVLIVNIYLAGIIFIIVIAIVMSLLIMEDTGFRPQVVARLRDDAKGIILRNNGNAAALSIHAALVPLNIEYDVPALGVEQTHEHLISSMVTSVKVVLSYRNERDQAFSQTFQLSSTEEFDPLKPMIPIFGWK